MDGTDVVNRIADSILGGEIIDNNPYRILSYFDKFDEFAIDSIDDLGFCVVFMSSYHGNYVLFDNRWSAVEKDTDGCWIPVGISHVSIFNPYHSLVGIDPAITYDHKSELWIRVKTLIEAMAL